MKLFNLFKKKEKEPRILSNRQLLDQLWRDWVKDKIESPLKDIMTVVSNIGAGGHAYFFDLCAEDTRFMQALNVAILYLPKPILDNMILARREYNSTPKHARGENFLENYDQFFYDNEELLDDLILKIAKGHI